VLYIHKNVSVVLQNDTAGKFFELFEFLPARIYSPNDRFVRIELVEAKRHVRVCILYIEQKRAVLCYGIVGSFLLARILLLKLERISHRFEVGLKSLFADGVFAGHLANTLHRGPRNGAGRLTGFLFWIVP
jgi:hypothetical protein